MAREFRETSKRLSNGFVSLPLREMRRLRAPLA
jgi:hypothetical protein